MCQLLADVHWQFEVAAGEQIPLFGKLFVCGYEVLAGYAVLVGEYEVFRLRGNEGAIEYARLLEAVVLVPYVFYGQAVAETVYQLFCVVARTVVGDYYFVGHACLVEVAPQCLFEPRGVVVGGDYHSYGFWLVHLCCCLCCICEDTAICSIRQICVGFFLVISFMG